jgi:hypothetical protein
MTNLEIILLIVAFGFVIVKLMKKLFVLSIIALVVTWCSGLAPSSTTRANSDSWNRMPLL